MIKLSKDIGKFFEKEFLANPHTHTKNLSLAFLTSFTNTDLFPDAPHVKY